MPNKKNGAFVLSIITLVLAALILSFVISIKFSNTQWLVIVLFPLCVAGIIMSNVALIKGITYIPKKLPMAVETVIFASLALFLIIVDIVLVYRQGFIHLSFSVGSEQSVDNLTKILEKDGYQVLSGPRITGDGYYESCIEGPEKILIEITV